MSYDNIIFAVICWFCSLTFGALALWAFKRKDPMHFWSGSSISPEEIADIPAYNRANGLMWGIYALSLIITGILSLFSMKAGFVLMLIVCVPGMLILIFVYLRIYNKYRKQN